MRRAPALRLAGSPLVFVAVAVATLAGGAISPARAAPPRPRGEPPTAGVAVPVGAIAGDPDATAVELDPANLGFLRAWNASYVHTSLAVEGARTGDGDGLYVATPVPYLSALSLGASLQLVRPPDGAPFHDEAKLALAVAVHPTPALSFGLSYAHLFLDPRDAASGLDTLDLSVAGRLGRFLAASLVVRDVSSPSYRGLGLQRVYEPELVLRPLGTWRLELGVAARIGERRGDVDPRLRLQVVPVPGIALRAALELKRDVAGTRAQDDDLRATVGLEVDLERVGVGIYGHGGGDTGAGALHGFSVTARVSGERRAPLVTPRRLERIDVSTLDDRRLTALVAHLGALERRPRTDGVLLVLGPLSEGWASMEELRGALVRLRAAGRHVFAYGAELNTKSYFVASAAERLWLDPAGGLRLVGMTATSTYFKGTFDKLGVRADFVKIAEYKSAPEQFTREGPSDEARLVRRELYDDIYGQVVATLAGARHLDGARVRALVDGGPYTAGEAAKLGLVDGLHHGDEIEPLLGELLGHPVEATPPDLGPRRPKSFAPPTIAVLYVDGDIVEGRSQAIPFVGIKLVGHETLLHAIEEARSAPEVRAIVLRIDSPGGSALASDLVARELARTRAVKPLVCSMGDVAASGGYFIAAPCERIFASPSTVTGSIGIYTGKFDLSGLLARLGVGWETAKRGEHADLESWFRPYTDDERRLVMEKLRYYYGRFVDAVATGRHLRPADVDAVGRGHVWSGAAAQHHKLVDELGGFADAVAYAKRLAGLAPDAEVELRGYPSEPATLVGQLAALLGIEVRASGGGGAVVRSPLDEVAALPALTPLLRALPAALLVAPPSTPMARLPYELHVD